MKILYVWPSVRRLAFSLQQTVNYEDLHELCRSSWSLKVLKRFRGFEGVNGAD